MKNDDLLFQVFKARTVGKQDVWKEEQIKRHPNLKNQLIGKKKIRYTVPIALLGTTKHKEKILLLIHTSTAKLNFNHFIIKADKFSKNLGAKLEFIYVFNVRVGLHTELITDHQNNLLNFGTIKSSARNGILHNSMGLIKNTKREKIIENILQGKYDNLNSRQWKNIIENQQFDLSEKFFINGNKSKKL